MKYLTILEELEILQNLDDQHYIDLEIPKTQAGLREEHKLSLIIPPFWVLIAFIFKHSKKDACPLEAYTNFSLKIKDLEIESVYRFKGKSHAEQHAISTDFKSRAERILNKRLKR